MELIIDGSTSIEYSMWSGKVYKLTIDDKVIEDSKINDELIKLIKEYNLDEDNGHGKRAFVLKLEEDGLLTGK